MRKEPCKFEWNVYVADFNSRRIKTHNIFANTRFVDDIRKAAQKFGEDREGFAEEVRKSLMYFYWSKCEWEIILQSWPPKDDFRDEKIDVYDQVMLNWPRFVDYVWENRKEFGKRKGKKNGT